MGALTPPSRKSCYNFRVTEITKVLDGDTIDVIIDLGFDLSKKERVRVAGVDTPELIRVCLTNVHRFINFKILQQNLIILNCEPNIVSFSTVSDGER